MEKHCFTDIPGIIAGHAQDINAATGCTIVICENGAVAGVDVRGGSPGTRETDTLNPICVGKSVHAVLLAGGSAFGLDAAAGVMQYLETHGIGRDVVETKIPIVCGAVLFDLKCGDYRRRPDKEMGYRACCNAYSGKWANGSVGAGTGAMVGKTKGNRFAMKGGLGSVCLRIGDLFVGAVMAVNCVGDVYDACAGKLVAGVLDDERRTIEGTEQLILENYAKRSDFFGGNTVIGAVATNAQLSKPEANKLASVAQNGIAAAIRPAHTAYDGDTIFTLATGKVEANPDAVGILAVRAVEQAIVQAVKSATALAGIPAYRDVFDS
ncbi:MAG: P1 family peptidase [Sporolactobacillus sp.]